MTQKAAIAKALLHGRTISIKTAFDQFGCTNAPREIGRGIIDAFGVSIRKTPVKFKSRYGKSGIYFKYKLNKSAKKLGIKKMREYIMEHK